MIRAIVISALFLCSISSARAQEASVPDTKIPAEFLGTAKAAFGTLCEFDNEFAPDNSYKAYELTYNQEGDAPDQPLQKATLHELFCLSGAYNFVTVYLLTKEYEGTLPVAFASPAFRPIYENSDSEKAVLRIDVQGFTTLTSLVNASFDAKTGEMTHFSKWRGIGDASSVGKWNFIGGEFVLTHFEVDASYDDQINPIVIYDASSETP